MFGPPDIFSVLELHYVLLWATSTHPLCSALVMAYDRYQRSSNLYHSRSKYSAEDKLIIFFFLFSENRL